MIKKLYQLYTPLASWKYILIGIGITILINVVAFPYAGQKIEEIAPQALGPIDLEFSYTPDEVYQMVESYTEKGRMLYVQSTIGIDILYPIIYSSLFIIILIILIERAFNNVHRVRYLILLPVFVFCSDILENTGIVLMLTNFPERLNSVAMVTSFFSSIKWSSVLLIFISIITLSTITLIKREND